MTEVDNPTLCDICGNKYCICLDPSVSPRLEEIREMCSLTSDAAQLQQIMLLMCDEIEAINRKLYCPKQE